MQFGLTPILAVLSLATYVAAQGSTILNPPRTTATATSDFNVGNPTAQCNYPGCGTHVRLSGAKETGVPMAMLGVAGLAAFL